MTHLKGEELKKAVDEFDKEIEDEEDCLIQSGWMCENGVWHSEKLNLTTKNTSEAWHWQKSVELKAKGWRQTKIKKIPYLCKDDSRIRTMAIYQHPETFKVYYFLGAVDCMDGYDIGGNDLLNSYADGKLLPELITHVILKDTISGKMYSSIVGDTKDCRHYYGY